MQFHSGRSTFKLWSVGKCGNISIMKYFVVFSILFVDYLAVAKLSNYLTICKYNDPNINECVRKSGEEILQASANRMPEFGIPPTNPLVFPKMVIAHGSGSYFVHFDVQNCKIYGLEKLKATSFRVDLEKFHLEGTFTANEAFFEFDYDVKGKILLLPISGNGHARSNFTSISLYISIDAQKIRRSNKEYYNITKVDVNSTIGGGSANLGNLFNGDKILGEAMNQAINSNIVDLYDFMGPAINEALRQIFDDFCKRIFRKVTVQELFPMTDNIES